MLYVAICYVSIRPVVTRVKEELQFFMRVKEELQFFMRVKEELQFFFLDD